MNIYSGTTLTRVCKADDNSKKIIGYTKLLSQLGTRGGEGTVYKCDIANKACKIYHKTRLDDNQRLAKLLEMQAKNLHIQGVCFPQELLYDSDGRFCGYLMDMAVGHKLQTSIMNPMVIRDKFPSWKRIDLVKVCIAIINIAMQLHKNNIIIGDVNANNIMVKSANEVYFIDCDSFQIGKYPCPVGTPYFTPREIQGKKYSEFLRTQEHDMFAITTLIFMILFLGKPPYSVRGGGNPAENVKNGNFPYRFNGKSGDSVPDGPWKFIWSNLTYKLKNTFNDCFSNNIKPNIQDLRTILKQYSYAIEQGYVSNEILPTSYKKVDPEIYQRYKS